MAAIPAIRTSTTLNPAVRVIPRERAETRANWFAATLVFLGLTYGFFCVGSLSGSVLAEKARRDGFAALARTKAAQTQEAVLSDRIDRLKSLKSIDAWAVRNGFIAPDQALPASLSKSRVP